MRSPVDGNTIKAVLLKRWKWLVISALVVAWITGSCGQSVLSTNPSCTWITSAIRGLLLPTETLGTVQKNNSKKDNSSRPITLYARPMYQNSYGPYENKTRNIKSAISIAENTGSSTNDLTIMYVCSITHSTISNYSKTTRASTHIQARLLINYGLMASLPLLNSTSKQPAIRLVMSSKKSQADAPPIIISVVTNTERPIGSVLSTYECRQDGENRAA